MTASQKLFKRAAELEAELAKVDAEITKLETQAEEALAQGQDADAPLAKASLARSKARALVKALHETEVQASAADWEESQAEARQAEAAVRNAAEPLRKNLRETFDALAAKAGSNQHLGPVVTALTAARDAALAAIDAALDGPAHEAYNSKWRAQPVVPIRDARGRRCSIDFAGRLVDPVTREPITDGAY